ncbi:J domain-containing protein DDB_G0295729 isoform X2 [Ceratitis capitata]|uniref:J domain-containing protein DDB_G0295729 isoform X2 n=1 Tax=Ceratitis capitata TaxID=7213 RepID=UPI000A11BE7D|nr:J domain-containing protein DDB_G0295729 isoform X2 [Ceratitis capitata]
MNSRNKRSRLELSVAPANIDAGINNSCAVNAAQVDTNSIGGTHNIFLSNTSNSDASVTGSLSMLPSNVFLTICDENSNESQEYLTIGSTLAQIKQEHEEALCIANQPSVENLTSGNLVNDNLSTSLNATLPMQLSNGCEIYIVKEYVDNMPTILTEDSEILQDPPSPPLPCTPTTTTSIKLEPDSSMTSTPTTTTTTNTPTAIVMNGVQILRNTKLPCAITTKSTHRSSNEGHIATHRNVLPVASMSAANDMQGNNTKRSCILEAYKKRDDKRRATHNEVERRRRDKINNWIFKLKEMLPTEGVSNNNNSSHQNNTMEQMTPKINTNNGGGINNNNNNNNNNNSNSSNRTPPSDSKSQILIKACEYIKTMQDEIKSLRECLNENENLRLSNQRLQNELQKLQSEQASATLHTRNFNSNFNITLNSLNSNNNSNGSGCAGSASSSPVENCSSNSNIFSTLNITPHASSTNAFTKRELIIRDYVD